MRDFLEELTSLEDITIGSVENSVLYSLFTKDASR